MYLDGDLATIVQPCPVYLPDAGSGQRFRVEIGKQFVQGLTELLFQHHGNVLEGHRGSLILQNGQLIDPGLGEQVRAAGQQLTDLQEGAALFQGGIAEAAGIALVQVGQGGFAHAGWQKGGAGTPQAVACHHLGQHPAGFAQALEAGWPAARLVGQDLHFLVHGVGATAHRFTGLDGLVGNLATLPGGLLNGSDTAFHHGQPGLQAAVFLFALGKVVERLPVGLCRGVRSLIQ